MPILQSALSASAIGTYVFDRGSTDEFSLSASLASPGNTTKAYGTSLGPLWIGEGVGGPGGSDVNNQQYDQIAPWTYDMWTGYYKGYQFTRTGKNNNGEEACEDLTEFAEIYVTAATYWGAGGEPDIVDNATQGYIDTTGQTVFDGDDQYYRIGELNKSYSIDANGVFSNERQC